MPENPAEASSAHDEKTEPASLRCGDCHAALEASSGPAQAEAGDFYCPVCAQDRPSAVVCGACGSAVCPACGTPVELADELGIG